MIRWTLGIALLVALALLTLAIALVQLLRCRHRDAIRQHRQDGWYPACLDCGRAVLLNPRDRTAPTPIGRFNAAKADHARRRADRYTTRRQALAAKRSVPSFPPDQIKKATTLRPWPKKAAR